MVTGDIDGKIRGDTFQINFLNRFVIGIQKVDSLKKSICVQSALIACIKKYYTVYHGNGNGY